MAAWLAVVRQAAYVTGRGISFQTTLSSASQASTLIQRRGLASGEGHQGTPKVKLGSETKNNEKEGRVALYCFLFSYAATWGLFFHYSPAPAESEQLQKEEIPV